MTHVTIQEEGTNLVAMLSGEIDHHLAAVLRQQIDDQIQKKMPSVLVLDFSGVTFMDSSGVGLILGRHRLLHSLGGNVVVRKVPREIKRMLSLAGIESKE